MAPKAGKKNLQDFFTSPAKGGLRLVTKPDGKAEIIEKERQVEEAAKQQAELEQSEWNVHDDPREKLEQKQNEEDALTTTTVAKRHFAGWQKPEDRKKEEVVEEAPPPEPEVTAPAAKMRYRPPSARQPEKKGIVMGEFPELEDAIKAVDQPQPAAAAPRPKSKPASSLSTGAGMASINEAESTASPAASSKGDESKGEETKGEEKKEDQRADRLFTFEELMAPLALLAERMISTAIQSDPNLTKSKYLKAAPPHD
eukprot:Selendium_serpulae@DN929_c0_g1_i1.p1